MKKFFLLFVLILILGCKNELKSTKFDTTMYPFYEKINEAKNNLQLEKYIEETKNEFYKKMLIKNFINDYPLYFDNAKKIDDNYALVNFRTPLLGELSDTKGNYKNFEKYDFNIIGKMKISDAEKLNQNAPCFVSGISVTEKPDDVQFSGSKLYLGNIVYDIETVKN